MAKKEIDFEEDINLEMSEKGKTKLLGLLAYELKISDAIRRLKVKLAMGEEIHRRLIEQDIPKAMSNEKLKEIESEGDVKVLIKPFLACSIPTLPAIEKEKDEGKAEELQQRRDNCFKWLKQNEYTSVIKECLKMDLDKKAKNYPLVTKNLNALIKKHGITDYSLQESVHPQTLKKVLDDEIKKGTAVPFDDFGVYTADKAVIKRK